jgi:hypothetical protein
MTDDELIKCLNLVGDDCGYELAKRMVVTFTPEKRATLERMADFVALERAGLLGHLPPR